MEYSTPFIVWVWHLINSEEDAGDKKDAKTTSKVDIDDQSETSYSGTESTESMWKPPAMVSEFRFMMEETEFNVKLVEVKQEVSLMFFVVNFLRF